MTDDRLIVFADYACPYCYLAETAVARLREDGASAAPAAFELRPTGVPLPGLDADWLRQAWTQSVEPLAAELNVRIEFPRLMTRTRKAHEAVAHARTMGCELVLHEALYRAYWHDGRDIGRIDVLMEIGAAVGLDATALKVALDIDQWTAHVEAEEAQAALLGVRAVPAYLHVRDNDIVAARVGLQRYDQLRDWIETT